MIYALTDDRTYEMIIALVISFYITLHLSSGFPDSSVGKESACSAGDLSLIWVGKIHRRRDRLPTPVSLGNPHGSAGKESSCNAVDLGLIPVLGRSLEKGKASHSSILAWRIPWSM